MMTKKIVAEQESGYGEERRKNDTQGVDENEPRII